MKCSEKMKSLKKDEGVLLLNFEEGPGVPLLNLRRVSGPTFKLSGQSPILGPGVLVPLLQYYGKKYPFYVIF